MNSHTPRLTAYRPVFTLLLSIVAALCTIVLLFVLLGPGAAQAQSNILYVDASAGGAGDGSSWADAYPTLQDALSNAASGDEIWVAAGVYYPDEGAGQTNDDRASTFTLQNGVAIYAGFDGTEAQREERDWETNITVLSGDIDHETSPDAADADGIVYDAEDISGNNAYHVVTSVDTDSSAVLDGFVITAGAADSELFPDDGGGGLVNLQGSATLANLVFSGNYAWSAGGGIANDAGALTLNNVHFSGNVAGLDGGGMFNRGTGGSSVAGSLTETPTLAQATGAPTLIDVTFGENSAETGGGMVNYLISPTLTSVTFFGNAAEFLGGGIYNVESNPTLNDVIFDGNWAGEEGGGMVNDFSSPVLQDVLFFENESDQLGGGISNYYMTESSIPESSLESNERSARGADRWANGPEQDPSLEGAEAAQALPPPTMPELTHVTFISNYAEVGGGMYSLASSPVLSDVTFVNNFAFVGGGMAGEGGESGFLLFEESEVQASHAASSNTPSLTNVSFISNTAEIGGGIFSQDITPTISSSSIISNFATVGGGMYNEGGSPTLTDVDFVDNFGLIGAGLANSLFASSDGREALEQLDGLDQFDSDSDLQAMAPEGVSQQALADLTSFKDRLARSEGTIDELGGDFLATLEQYEDTFASANGASTLTLNGVSFHRNQSLYIAGGFLNAGSAQLTDVHFERNGAIGFVEEEAPSGSIGGGMVHLDASALIIASSQEAAQAHNGASLTDVTFLNNFSALGGGLAAIGYSENVAAQSSVFNGDSGLTLLNVAFTGNLALQGGGGMVISNTAPALANVSFSGNLAEYGGALRNFEGHPTVTNASFAGNRAMEEGAAMFNSDSNPLIQNSIFWGNEEGETVTAGIVNDASTPLFTHSLVQDSGGSAAWDAGLGTDGGGNIDADPLFTRAPDSGDGDWTTLGDNDYGDLRLQTGSPAVDVADNDADLDGAGAGTATIGDVSNDLADHPRIVNAVVDMGAYELQSAELALVKNASALEVLPGQPLTYTLTFSNTGYGPANEVLVVDEIPTLLTGLSYTATVPVTPTNGSSYTWDVADLPPGFEGVITVSGVVSDGLTADTTFTNTATISTARLEGDDQDNSDSVAVTAVVPRVSFSTDSYTVDENGGAATITVALDSANPYAGVQVAYETADGTATAGSDYTESSGDLTIPAGSTEATFEVPILDDDEAEPDETVLLTLGDPQGAALTAPETATLTIIDDDPHIVHLPLILRQEPAGLPDLVISDLIVSGNDLQVVVANVGEGPANDPFWVDAYINPDEPPETVNDVWWIVGDEGMVWGITDDALPLRVGESITLTVGDAYYVPVESGFSGVIPAGAELYAQADSAHTGDPFGGVVETHEAAGGPYNNILGPVTAATPQQITVPTGAPQRPAGLPPR
ncbi:MAG: Calx-beta domain-containing protein [Chloroflexota bacterium]